MKVRYSYLPQQFEDAEDLWINLKEFVKTGDFTLGEPLREFERKFAQLIGTKHAIGVNSGTDAIKLALRVKGVSLGDEVITTANTFVATVGAIAELGAIPVFIDCDDTFCMDTDLLEAAITEKTKAILPVHFTGYMTDMRKLLPVAKKHNIPVIEDSAQCVLGYIDDKLVGTFGDMASWSFETKKHLSTGEGGMVTTDNEEYGTTIRKNGGIGYKTLEAGQSLRQLLPKDFQNPHYKRHDVLGWNYRMNELTAAVGLAQLERVEFLVERRKKIAKMYDEAFKDCDFIIPQKVLDGHINTYWTYTVRYEGDDWFRLYDLVKENGGDGFYGGLSIPYQEPVMSNYSYVKGECPNAEIVQPKMMQFKCNYRNLDEANSKIDILKNILSYQ